MGMPTWLATTLGIVACTAVAVAPAVLLVMARRKQKRAGGFPSVDPGLGPWNAFPLSVNRNHDVVDPTTGDTGGAARDDTEVGRRPRAAPGADGADDAVARIRARRRQRDDRT